MRCEDILTQNGIDRLYHFTDFENLESIVQNGGLYSWLECEKKGINVSKPGGGDLSRVLDRRKGLEDYVRLSFAHEHPMMHVAMREGRISSPVILEIDPEVALLEGTKFSDRNAASNDAIIGYGQDGLRNIKFDVVTKSCHYYDLEEDEKKYYQAEILVENFIPLKYITNIGIFSLLKKLHDIRTCHNSILEDYRVLKDVFLQFLRDKCDPGFPSEQVYFLLRKHNAPSSLKNALYDMRMVSFRNITPSKRKELEKTFWKDFETLCEFIALVCEWPAPNFKQREFFTYINPQ